jgi:hypothetical protein
MILSANAMSAATVELTDEAEIRARFQAMERMVEQVASQGGDFKLSFLESDESSTWQGIPAQRAWQHAFALLRDTPQIRSVSVHHCGVREAPSWFATRVTLCATRLT